MMKPTLVATLYNPHEQSKEELIQRFVVRQKVFQNVYQDLKSSDLTRPGSHYLLEGQRGMGKTTLLLRLSYEIENDPDLQRWLIPIVLKEEAYYGIRRLETLWETIVRELARKDPAFAGLPSLLNQAARETADYERACFGLLIEALQGRGKQILLFIDNFGELLYNFTLQEYQRLYEILGTFPELRLFGATTVVLEAFANAEENGFYTLFKKQRLHGLTKEETHDLLLELADVQGKRDLIQQVITQQPGRIESLRILTGGVIRTMVLLFEIFTETEETNTLTDLNIVLDRVTPLYKSRMDMLLPLQREVVNAIALNWDAISADEIAQHTRLDLETTRSVLTDLEHIFLLETVSAGAEQIFYRLKERFFNIWYLMRLSPDGNQTKVTWLLHFLENWYGKVDLNRHAKKHIRAIATGGYQPDAAYYLTEAFARTGQLDQDVEDQMIQATKQLLQESDSHLAEDLLPSDREVFRQGEACYQREEYEQAITSFLKLKQKNHHILFRLGYAFSQLGYDKEAGMYWFQAAEKGHVDAMVSLGILCQQHLHEYSRAEEAYKMAVEKGRTDAMLHLGNLYYHQLQDYAGAEQYYRQVIKEGKVRSTVLTSGNFSLKGLRNYLVTAIKGEIADPERYQFQDFPGAKTQYLQAIKQTASEAMFQLGNLYLHGLDDRQQAETYYAMAADAGHVMAMTRLADFYAYTTHDYKKAEKYYLKAATYDETTALANLGFLYHNELKKIRKAEKYYTLAAEKGDVGAMNGLAWMYFERKRQKRKALHYVQCTLDAEKNMYTAHTAACIYLWNNRPDEAVQIAEDFMYAADAYDTLEKDMVFYLMLLLAKQRYHQCDAYFSAPELDLRERFRPVYYALLYFTENENYQKLPPELSEPVHEIIRQVKQMTVDYK